MVEKFGGSYNDSIPLMRQLTKMANMPWTGAQRMILVLDIDHAPTLIVQALLDKESTNPEDLGLIDTPLEVKRVEKMPSTDELYRKTTQELLGGN